MVERGLPRDIKWLRTDAEYRRLERESLSFEWEGYEDQQWKERRKACLDRCKVYGKDSCELRGRDRGDCPECEHDMAEALETEASKRRRAAAQTAMRARATVLRSTNRKKDQTHG